ncbi:putative ADP-ribosylation factor-like protein 5C isoform X2 [Pseudonaja textilis]|uniref:putative ADP-ribosylation factor-like protein 5C isoform X2 n=1 Tax=Pseudonaja textilis TaxID=8673 RepID=UPI000EAA45EF|nr:putative ADP-ribosylation factor-like protein 5C isoform X2 [Pseudonaja textilis]
MGQFFVKLLNIFGSREHKVIIIGLDNAGKTTILYQFLMNEVVHTSPTIGSNVEEIIQHKTHFLMWDIGGQENLRSTWNTYYSNTEFVILVIDSTDRERLTVTKEELYKMLAHEPSCRFRMDDISSCCQVIPAKTTLGPGEKQTKLIFISTLQNSQDLLDLGWLLFLRQRHQYFIKILS